MCLVNPTQVIAVPWQDEEYGKLRCCAYLPIAIAKYDYNGSIIPYTTESGMEEPYVTTILYDGAMATEKEATYVIPNPTEDNLDIKTSKSVSDKLIEVARKHIMSKV